MRTYTIKFKDKDRGDLQVKAEDIGLENWESANGHDDQAAYNFKIPNTNPDKEDVSVAWVPFSEVLAIIS